MIHERHVGVTLLAAILSCFGMGCASPRFYTWDRGATPSRSSTQTLGVVRIDTPWYAPNFVVRSRFRDAVPEYEAIATLDDKYFILTEDARFGGIYVWRSRTDAQAYYTDAWRRGVRERRGADPEVDLFGVSSVIEGTTRIGGELIGERSLSYPASATLLLWKRTASIEPASVAAVALDLDGMVRSFVVTDEDSIGLVTIWPTRSHAEAGVASSRVTELGAPAVRATFEVPVLMDATLRAAASSGDPR